MIVYLRRYVDKIAFQLQVNKQAVDPNPNQWGC